MAEQLTDNDFRIIGFAAKQDGWWLAGQLAQHLDPAEHHENGSYWRSKAGATGKRCTRLVQLGYLERRTWANGTRAEYRIAPGRGFGPQP